MFFLLYRRNDIDKIIEGNYQNYVIDKLKCEIMENKPLGSRMLFLWILRVVYFPVKHSCLYNKTQMILQWTCEATKVASAFVLASTKADVPRVFLRVPQSSPLLKNNSRLVLLPERGRRRTMFPLFFSRDKYKTIQKTIEKRKKGKKNKKE